MFMFLLMILLIGFRTLNNKIISDENLKQSKQKQPQVLSMVIQKWPQILSLKCLPRGDAYVPSFSRGGGGSVTL